MSPDPKSDTEASYAIKWIRNLLSSIGKNHSFDKAKKENKHWNLKSQRKCDSRKKHASVYTLSGKHRMSFSALTWMKSFSQSWAFQFLKSLEVLRPSVANSVRWSCHLRALLNLSKLVFI